MPTPNVRPGAPEHFFWIGLLLLLAFALGHSLWATSLDGFTIDEPYHIAAGASYLRWGDYRLNPEHPPLVKLIAGLSVPPRVLHPVGRQALGLLAASVLSMVVLWSAYGFH